MNTIKSRLGECQQTYQNTPYWSNLILFSENYQYVNCFSNTWNTIKWQWVKWSDRHIYCLQSNCSKTVLLHVFQIWWKTVHKWCCPQTTDRQVIVVFFYFASLKLSTVDSLGTDSIQHLCCHILKYTLPNNTRNRPLQILSFENYWPCLGDREDETSHKVSDTVQNEYHFHCVLPWPNHLYTHKTWELYRCIIKHKQSLTLDWEDAVILQVFFAILLCYH